ncbi:MAG: UDP-3-O-acyl-N-acetylglucosamine deacetylase [Planctomycetota bacterium]
MNLQRTIKSEVKLSGRGLFSGEDSRVTFKPAPEETGIVFVRTDLAEPVRIRAVATNIADRGRRTAVKKGSVSVETIEHCLAAVNAMEIDNLLIETAGAEMPGFDGSSDEYFKAMKRAGIEEQDSRRKEFVIDKPISLIEGDASIYALPGDRSRLSISYELDYSGHTAIGRQSFGCRISPEGFEKYLARARTFLLEAEAKQFQARGIGTHLSPRDILVISSDGPIKNSFRFPDECARHKVVDLLGDLVLSGCSIRGRIVAFKSGHSLNQRLARKLLELAEQRQRIFQSGTDALLDIRKIQKILPHRYPFLLVDKVIEIEGTTRIKGIKNVTFNEPFFQGHFPITPIMPGVLIVEAMAQLSGLLFAQTLEHTGKLAVLVTMDEVKIRKSVMPGDQIVMTAEVIKARRRTAQCSCKAEVAGQVAAEALMKFMLVDEEMI